MRVRRTPRLGSRLLGGFGVSWSGLEGVWVLEKVRLMGGWYSYVDLLIILGKLYEWLRLRAYPGLATGG